MNKLIPAVIAAALIPGAVFAKDKPVNPDPSFTIAHQVIVDSDGVQLGDFQTSNGQIYINRDETLYQLPSVKAGGFYDKGNLLYDLPDCAGNWYVYKFAPEFGVTRMNTILDGVFYKADDSLPPATIVIASLLDVGLDRCINFPSSYGRPDLYPAVPFIDLNVYPPPFTYKFIPAK